MLIRPRLVAYSIMAPSAVETLKMFNIIILKGNITDETANTRICTTVSEGYPQTICQNLDNLKPENGSNSIESNIFTFNSVPVNASFHSCIQRLIYPNVTLCDNFGSRNYQGPTIEQLMLPFFGVNPADAQDDEGYTYCPQYLTELQCYGKVVKTPDDGYDVNDTSIERANKSMSTFEVSSRQQEPSQTRSSGESSDVYYEGLAPCDTLVTSDHRALTSQEKVVLERVLSPMHMQHEFLFAILLLLYLIFQAQWIISFSHLTLLLFIDS